MNSQVTALKVVGTIFGLLCVAHIYRLVTALPVQIGNYAVPPSVSIAGAVITALLSLWTWRLAARSGGR